MKETWLNSQDRPIRVLVVDDSPMMCKAIEKILSEDEAIEVAGKALSGKEALHALASGGFDVCTLDVHMPGMNGLSVLKNIMVKHPLPTLMVSAFTGDGSKITFEALRFGAVDFFKKPARNGDGQLEKQAELLRKSLKRASRVQVKAARYLRVHPVRKESDGLNHSSPEEMERVCVVYGSTGSYSSVLALVPFLSQLPKGPVIISMGVDKENLAPFVDYLQPYSRTPLNMVTDTVELAPSQIYFLPSNFAAHFDRAGKAWEMTVKQRPIESSKEGAIDLTLLSASESFGPNLLSIFVSGDSFYGVTGAKEVIRNNGKILVQKPGGCLAPYNPEMLIEKFGVESAEPHELARTINKWMT
ncbi:MAG: chemotaxis protein CheB [Thermodesulfobacteria bacterium]|nr:chemotaxis protein CheB [Thermodesulfobacteriota bacterium]